MFLACHLLSGRIQLNTGKGVGLDLLVVLANQTLSLFDSAYIFYDLRFYYYSNFHFCFLSDGVGLYKNQIIFSYKPGTRPPIKNTLFPIHC